MRPTEQLEKERFLAFEGLLGWTQSIIVQSARVKAAHENFIMHFESNIDRRFKILAVQTEQHLFVIAANQFFKYRRWVGALDIIDNQIFCDIDAFGRDVNVLRDMKEHVVEYFKNEGLRPNDFVFSAEQSQKKWGESAIADASSTMIVGNSYRIGNRLDIFALAAAAENVLDALVKYGPFFSVEPQYE